MAFSDPIVAGNTLVREAIQSTVYDPGSAGWNIAADGSSEFTNLTTRGRASGSSASYNSLTANNSFTYKGTELQTLIDANTKGVLAWGYRYEQSSSSSGPVVSTYAMRASFTSPNRAADFSVEGQLFKSAAAGWVLIEARYAYNANAAIDSPPFCSQFIERNEVAGMHHVHFGQLINDTGSNVSMGIMITITTSGECTAQFSSATAVTTAPSFMMKMVDVGPAIEDGIGDTRIAKSFDLACNDARQYNGQGQGYSDSAYWQGGAIDFVGNRKSYFYFDRATLTILSMVGAQYIDSIQIYLNFGFIFNSADVAVIGYHNVPPSPNEPGAAYDQIRVPMTPNAGVWIDILPGTTMWNALMSNTFTGYTIGTGGNTSIGTNYANTTGPGADQCPRIRANYRS